MHSATACRAFTCGRYHYTSGRLVTAFRKGHKKVGGRKKGVPNKVPVELKSAILGALDASGGQSYLEQVARDNPQVFCSLLGRVLPMTVQGDKDNPLKTVLEITWAKPSNG